jgi:molybdopterin-guanine dinucleotide biosynthesis protein A
VQGATPSWTAVVLAGGRGSRMGGVDKPRIEIDGRTLLARAISGIPSDVPVVVVGPAHDDLSDREIRVVREEPAFGGPVAALAAALPLVSTPLIGLVGGDMPAAGALLTRLAAKWDGEPALVPVDATGRRQPLCSVLTTDALTGALAAMGEPAGRSLRDLLGLLDVRERPLDDEESALLVDVDVPEDLDRIT